MHTFNLNRDMKKIGKIGVFLFLIFVLTGISLLVQEILGMRITRLTMVGALITCYGSYFFTYSKWANDNIWNTNTSKPNNTSYTSSEEVVEPIDDNRDILSNINLPSLSGSKDALQKIEELKRQIESLEQSIKNNASNSETESPELSEEESDIRTYKEQMKDFEPETDNDVLIWIVVIVLLVIVLATILYGTSN